MKQHRWKSLLLVFSLLLTLIPFGVFGAEEADPPASRGAVVQTLWELAGSPVVNYIMPFADVDEDRADAEAIRWAAAEGIVNGVGEKTFAPDGTVTREQMATILYRCEQKQGGGFVGAWVFLLPQADRTDISGWADEAMHWCVMKRILLGDDANRLNPKAPVTVSEVQLMMDRYAATKETDYSDSENWAYYGSEETGAADVFFITPTSVFGVPGYNLAPVNAANNAANLGSINMEKGIYDTNTRFFAPYYRQITLAAYKLDEETRQSYLETAYQDVKAAFDYYMENENKGRPIIIAGFSQGAELGLRLVGEYSTESSFREQLVAAYCIGWPITDKFLTQYPELKPAQGETDTGVVISFEAESESHKEGSVILPKDAVSYAINPLNWKTDSTLAGKELNKGACFTDYEGNITKEIKNFCGAWLEEGRGALKVSSQEVSEEKYPSELDIFGKYGFYHIYNYQFFYRNLQENVAVRLANFLAK